MEIPVIINCVVGGIVAIATIVIAGATVVNLKINKSIKKVMKLTAELNLQMQIVQLLPVLLQKITDVPEEEIKKCPKEWKEALEAMMRAQKAATKLREEMQQKLDKVK